jgi:hypothetical protein
LRGQGEKLLEDHFVGDLDLLKIMAEADAEDAQKDLAEQKALKLRFNNGVKALKQLYFNGNPDGTDFTENDYRNGLQDFMNSNNNFLDLDNVEVELKKAQDWEPEILNKRASLVYLANIVDGPTAEVTREEWNRMHPDVKILVQDQKLLVEEPFGFDEQGFTDVVKAQNERFETHLKDIGGANKTTADFVSNSIALANKSVSENLTASAILLLTKSAVVLFAPPISFK